MSIQYPGGTIVNDTFVTTTGTRREIVDGIVAKLTTAGWSTISGGGTGHVVMQSASTPDSRQIQVDLNDPGSGNCAQIKMRNVAGTKVSQAYYLLPAASKTFRVIANRYQFFVFTPGASAAREFVAMGVPYIPTFLQSGGSAITGDNGWIDGNGTTDSSTTLITSFRTRLSSATAASNSSYAMFSTLINNNLLNVAVSFGGAIGLHIGMLTLISSGPADFSYQGGTGYGSTYGYRWFDNSLQILDALIASGLTSYSEDEAKIWGQMWGAIVVTEPFAGDSTVSFDGHTFFAITNNNSGGNVDSGQMRGTLFIAVD